MTEKASLVQAPTCAVQVTGRRRVVGKAQLTVSAVGMLILLGSLCLGRLLEAGIAFLLTTAILEIMFQRALGLFHAASDAQAIQRQAIGRETPRAAAAGE